MTPDLKACPFCSGWATMTERAPTPQELEEAKEEARFWMQNPSIAWADVLLTALEGAESENQKLRASRLEAVGALEPFVRAFRTLDTRFDGETKVMIELPTTRRVRPMTYVYVEDVLRLRNAATRLSSSLEGGEGSGWLPIESAPKDGTWIQARIPGHGEDNIILWVADALEDGNGSCGAWAFALEDQEPPDCWSDGWCWAVNEDGVRSAWPTHWKLPPPPEHQAVGGE